MEHHIWSEYMKAYSNTIYSYIGEASTRMKIDMKTLLIRDTDFIKKILIELYVSDQGSWRHMASQIYIVCQYYQYS